jgi:hypothetical protein
MDATLSLPPGPSAALRAVLLAALALLIVTETGCVRRRMTIRTNPPGAKVYVDDIEVGTSPVSTNFTYYASRKITLIKDGFRTETTYHRMLPPWYEIPGVDFVSENLYPRELRDERVVDFQLVPQENVPLNELLNRAEALRENAQTGSVSPLLPGQSTPQPEQLPPVGIPGQGLPDNAPLPYPLPPPTRSGTPLGASRGRYPLFSPGTAQPAGLR